ncbi:MAG: S1 RNA-binding domain-containing protein [Candidatus Portnoybacteria bacterium]|nr:S1 RNA-binding domain-containing protein [Candidatus Portnoybacteria bacterium]MDD4982812.1 S1 RNA-binding domain-containing protein [Candidatus Portnoybacteria bacterium]
MTGLLAQSPKTPKLGEIVTGKVLEVSRSTVFIDLGAAGTGVLLGREIKENRNLIKSLKPGDEISAMVLEAENENGFVELSLQAAHREQSWDVLRKISASQEIVKARVTAANRGGLMIELSGVAGFLPVSQLSHEHYPRVEDGDKNKILQELNKFINKEMEVRILDVDPSQQKLIVSEKAVGEEKVRQALSQYQMGELVEGTISGVVDFGAFVRFPLKGTEAQAKPEMIEGLIHISEIDWQLIEDPRQLLHAGQKVTAKIIGIEKDRLSLSLKALKKDPWQNIEGRYAKDQIVKGEVTKINTFGAFVQLDKDIHGLVHVSDFGSPDIMNKQLQSGQKYDFKIVSIEPAVHKMALSLVRPESAAKAESAAETETPKTE